MTDGEVALHETPASTSLDWDALRKQSLEPYGFGDARKSLWPQLLHVDATSLRAAVSAPQEHPTSSGLSKEGEGTDLSADLDEALAHRDERQIGLDTNRSFVLYPVDDGPERERLKKQLHDLIVSVFRKRRHLNYFQGYHDIVSVLFLTLPPEVQAACVEKMSLHRLRDAMGMTLEPVVGLLRILKRLLHAADPEFASILEHTSPLPYFALSNNLTLLSHDVPTLPLIQHIFDYLLCRHPIAVVYLVTAILLSRRDEVRQLVEEGDEGMIHSVLSSMPELYEEDDLASLVEDEDTKHANLSASLSEPTDVAANKHDKNNDASKTNVNREHSAGLGDDSTTIASISSLSDTSSSVGDDESTTVGGDTEDDDVLSSKVADSLMTTQSTQAIDTPPPEQYRDAASESHPQPEEELSEQRPSSRASTVTQSEDVPPRPRIALTSLLMQADNLYSRFPPSHPSIALSSVMGPQSVMLTWSEDPAELPSDDDAELMVTRPELVVLPYIESDDEVASDDGDTHDKHRGRRRKPRKPRNLVLQRKTMVAGAVLVLGVAVAVYGIQNGNSAGLFRSFADTQQHQNSVGREWKRMSSFVGGLILGVGERIFEPLLHLP